jgi:nucleoside-diphosphate-sugar epimerase
MEKILITGSLGYIGSIMSSNLAENGYDCIGYDTGFFKNNLLYSPPQTKTVLKDVRDLTESDLHNVDVVVHLAGISNDPMGNLSAELVYDPTRIYSLKIAKLCKKIGVRFIFASSCSVYGLGGGEQLTESSDANPQTGYSLNKLQIEEDLHSISDKNFSPIALRFATIFGLSPRIRFDVVINMLVGMAVSEGTIVLNSDGQAWRPNLHILDACEAVRCAIDLKYDGQELLVLNVGGDKNNLQVIQIAEIIQQCVSGSELKFLNDNPDIDKDGLIRDRKVKQGRDTRTYKVSFEKIHKTMSSFKCKWSVEDGVRDMVSVLNDLSFNTEIFKRKGFYRLQHLEYLCANNLISDDLRWVTSQP